MGFNTQLFFALSIFTQNCCNSSNYKYYDLQRDKVCKQELSIGQGNRSSIKVSLNGDIQDWNWKKDYECTFFVKVNFEMGLFAVIQEMNLRREKYSNDCIDFIKFRHGKKKNILTYPTSWFKGDKSEWSAPICGNVERFAETVTIGSDESSLSKETEIVPHAFLDPNGEVEVKLHISRRKVEDFSLNNLLLVVAFTSFTSCKTDMGSYRSCGHNTCINKEYFYDGVVNCPYYNCVDETECSDVRIGDNDNGSLVNAKITITAVTSIFLSFFLFLGCIMLCRYMEIMCWSGNNNPDRGTELSQVEPSAPPPPSPDKDLPPAYETLFPDG